MALRVYIETSVVSYLTALPSRDLVRTAHQQVTLEWWHARQGFELYASEAVLLEAGRGDADAAARRLAALGGIPLLAATDEAGELAAAFLTAAALPARAAIDAAHIAIATLHGMDILLTWNCAHIANAIMRPKIEEVCRSHDYEPPVICTPEELVAEDQ